MGKRSTYLVPFCAQTGSLLHYVGYSHERPPEEPCRREGLVNYQRREIDWRCAEPFEPSGPVVTLDAMRGRSAAYIVLAGPVLSTVVPYKGAEPVEVRATYPVGLAGILGFIRGGAFDERGVLRPGVKLRPVKRGDNYLAEFHRDPPVKGEG